jgi:hypothetical protein
MPKDPIGEKLFAKSGHTGGRNGSQLKGNEKTDHRSKSTHCS